MLPLPLLPLLQLHLLPLVPLQVQRMARQRVPRMFYEYADSGSYSMQTYAANEDDFRRLLFKQRVLQTSDVSDRSLATELVGQPVSMPVALAPTGMAGMQHPDGEVCAAQAAEAAGVPFVLSTMSICSIEEVAERTNTPFWFQVRATRSSHPRAAGKIGSVVLVACCLGCTCPSHGVHTYTHTCMHTQTTHIHAHMYAHAGRCTHACRCTCFEIGRSWSGYLSEHVRQAVLCSS